MPPGCNCVPLCVLGTGLRTLDLQLETHRCVQIFCVLLGADCMCALDRSLFPYRMPSVSELISQRLLKDLNIMKTHGRNTIKTNIVLVKDNISSAEEA